MTSKTSSPPAQTPRKRRGRSFASARSIIALILREMGSSYGRSPGGYLWAVLEPLAGIALLSLVFSAAFSNPPLGSSFPTFYATGMMPFVMFTDLHNKTATSITYSKHLLVYPTVTFTDAILARFLLNAMTQIMISYMVLGGCILAFTTQVTPDLPIIILSFFLAALLALGVGTLNCFLFAQFNLWHRAWSVIMRPMFLVSGIFFFFEAIPPQYQSFLWWNPLIHIVGLSRTGFYSNYGGHYVSIIYVCLLSLSCMVLGLIFLRRYYRDMLNN